MDIKSKIISVKPNLLAPWADDFYFNIRLQYEAKHAFLGWLITRSNPVYINRFRRFFFGKFFFF